VLPYESRMFEYNKESWDEEDAIKYRSANKTGDLGAGNRRGRRLRK
jgi:hypothetical protein